VFPAFSICTVHLSDMLLLSNKISPTLAACLFPIVFVANMYCTVVTEMVVAEAIVVAEATVVMTDEVEEVAVDMTVVVIAMHQSKLFSAYS